MSEENGFTQEQVDQLLAENASKFDTERASMQSKMDELLSETKAAKAKQREEAAAAKEIADAKSLKDGDFEQLLKSSQGQNETLTQELNTLRSGIATEKEGSAAMLIASQLADGDNAGLLSDYIAKRLKHTDEGMKVLDSNGQLTVSTVEDLTSEFKGNVRFASLLKGNQSSGGGANGGENSSGATSKILTRAEFDGLDSFGKSNHFKNGGTITD